MWWLFVHVSIVFDHDSWFNYSDLKAMSINTQYSGLWVGLGILCKMHILQRKSPVCLKNLSICIFARPVNFSGKCSKLLFQWYKSAVKPYLGLLLWSIFFSLRLTFAQHFLLSAENISFLHKMCDFAQNFSFCCLWSPFLHFQIAYFP